MKARVLTTEATFNEQGFLNSLELPEHFLGEVFEVVKVNAVGGLAIVEGDGYRWHVKKEQLEIIS